MVKHYDMVCNDCVLHSMNKENFSANTLTASAASTIPMVSLPILIPIISHHSSLSFFGGLSIKAENKNTDAAISPANMSPIN